jgi:hypothetical protein
MTSLYLLVFDTPPDNSIIRKRLEYFEATDVDTGDAANSIEFRLPNNFNPDRTSWQSFLTESGCSIDQSSLPK